VASRAAADVLYLGDIPLLRRPFFGCGRDAFWACWRMWRIAAWSLDGFVCGGYGRATRSAVLHLPHALNYRTLPFNRARCSGVRLERAFTAACLFLRYAFYRSRYMLALYVPARRTASAT